MYGQYENKGEGYSSFEEAFLSCEWLRTFGWDYVIMKDDIIVLECHDYSYWH
jgi:hypothetical protein